MDTGHPLPKPEDKDIKIIGVESNPFKRKIKEAIYIQANDPPLNRNIGKFNLPPIYNQLLEGGAGGKLLISKTVKDAVPKIKLKKLGDANFQVVRD